MTKQPVFPDLCDAMKRKRTRRELFLSEMDAAESVAQPHYPKAGSKGGRPAMLIRYSKIVK